MHQKDVQKVKKRYSYGLISVLFACCIALVGGYIYSLYLQNEIWKAWKQTLWEDCTDRMMEINTKTIYTFSKTKSPDIQIKSENNTHHIEKKESSSLTDDEKIFWANQLYLSIKNPVKIERIDSLFQKNLTQAGLSFKTAISLYDTTTHKSSLYTQDKSVQRLYGYWETTYKEELQKVLPLKGYAKGNWIETILCTKEYYLLLLIIIVFVFIPLSYEKGRLSSLSQVVPIIQKPFNESLSIDNETLCCETESNMKETDCIQSNMLLKQQDKSSCSILLNTDKHTVIYEEKEIPLAPKTFNLFFLLTQGTNYFQSYDYLIYNLWSEKDNIEKKHLEQLVIRLRKNLKEISLLNIDAIRGSGYQLNFESNTDICFSYIGSYKATDNDQDNALQTIA